MKNKRGIVALLLVMCFVLTAVPTFAATWEAWIEPEKIVIPEEGITITGSSSGAAQKLGGKSGVAFVLTKGEEKKIGIQNANNVKATDLNGLEISGTVTYKLKDGMDTGNELTTFTVDKAPIGGIRFSSGGNLCLEVSRDDIIAHSPELEGEAQFGKESGNFKMAEITITPGSWKAPTATFCQSDDFPAGTVFLSSESFTKTSTTGTADGWGGYYTLNANNSSFTAELSFFPKESGEYEIWMLTSSHGSSTEKRTPKLQMNGVTATIPIDKTTYGTGNNQTIWAKSDATVTLTKGQETKVQVSSGGNQYARFGGAVFVPVDAENKPTANFRTHSSEEGRISKEMLVQLEKMTTVQLEAGPDVSLTVDGAAVQAKAWADTIKGAVDATGSVILNPTVADALASAGKTEPETGRMLVYMDGVLVVNPAVTYVKEGAVITTEMKEDGFKPVAFSGTMASSADGLYPENQIGVRVMLLKSYFDSKFSDYTAQLAEARLAGVLYPRDVLGVAKFNTTNGHVVFHAKPLERMKVDYNTKLHEAVYGGITTTSKKVDAVANEALYTEDDKVVGIRSDMVHQDPWYYCSSDLYVVDKYTSNGTYVFDNGGHKLITVDGAEDMYIVTATYDENGNLVDTSVQTKVVTTNHPLALTVADNQKVYIWRNRNYIGTTMEPLWAPITK